MKVMIVKEVMKGDVSPVAMFFKQIYWMTRGPQKISQNQYVESGKHRKKCESVLGHKKQSFGPLNFHFSPQVPQFHSFSRKNQSESPFQVYFAYGSCKKHIISTIFQHFGAPRPKIWTLGHQKSPPVHWLWSLRETLPD